VVVKDRYIEAARCTLPLSQTGSIGKRMLGTRHRAALGISEQADVFVMVLSEETGEFAVAQAGRLSLGLTSAELRDRLTSAITSAASTKQPKTDAAKRGRNRALETREAIDR
jgi:diadenylate cyclase